MRVNLHANARTTPKSRAEIQALAKHGVPVAEIASLFGVHSKTVDRWKDRTSVEDRSHKAHKLAIDMSPEEWALVVELRTTVELPLDDIVEVMQRCVNPSLSRSVFAAIDRATRFVYI